MSPHRRSFDYGVAVIGGGPAGIAAALAAAGCGADVLLVERANQLGGNVSQALVHTICGLYLPSNEREPQWAHQGVPRAFAETLKGKGATGPVEWSGQAGFLPIDPAAFASEAERLCDRSGRIHRWNGATLTRLTLTGSSCELGIERVGEGSRVVHAWTVIDTTGDASAAALAGIAVAGASAAELQHASYIFRLDGVDTDACNSMERARATVLVARAARLGRLPSTAASIVLRPATRKHSLYVTLNLPKPLDQPFDPMNALMLDKAQRRAQADAEAIVGFLTAERDAFAGARVGEWPRRLGIRETRRVNGLLRMEEGEVLHGIRTDDEACVSTWPVEMWQEHDRLTFRPVAGPSSVPLGCLIVDHPTRRMAAAGRCVSASREALGALRVIGTSMATGEAAGSAAAIALRHSADLSSVDPAAVRRSIASGLTTSHW